MFVVHNAVLIIIGLLSTSTFGSDAVLHADCIMLIGGFVKFRKLIEYYHPDDTVECADKHVLPLFNVTRYQAPMEKTSGCYLTGSQQIVIRDSRTQPDTTTSLWLTNGLVTSFHSAHGHSPAVLHSTSAAIGPARCLFCGGKHPGIITDKSIADECYEFKSPNKWSSISSLPHQTEWAASVSLGEYYYVIGGNDKLGHPTDKLYRYKSEATGWEEKKSMRLRRAAHSAAPFSVDELITCGGTHNNIHLTAICEVYNSRTNTWRFVGHMIVARRSFALVNFNDQIYALGGIQLNSDGSERLLDIVDRYDRANDVWSEVKKPLDILRDNFLAFAINLSPTATHLVATTTPTTQTTTPPTTIPPATTTPPTTTMTSTTTTTVTSTTTVTPPTTTMTKTTTPRTTIPPAKTTPPTTIPTTMTTPPPKVTSKARNSTTHRQNTPAAIPNSSGTALTQEAITKASMNVTWLWFTAGISIGLLVSVVTLIVTLVCLLRRHKKCAATREQNLQKDDEFPPTPRPRLKNYAKGTYTAKTEELTAAEPDTVTSHRINVSLPSDGEYSTTGVSER